MRSIETTRDRFHLVYIRGYRGCRFVKEAATSVPILRVWGIQVLRGSSSLSVYLRGAVAGSPGNFRWFARLAGRPRVVASPTVGGVRGEGGPAKQSLEHRWRRHAIRPEMDRRR